MSEALRLAQRLEILVTDAQDHQAAAAELRRLHALNAELVEALCCCRDMVAHPDNLAFIDAALAKAHGIGGGE